MKTPKLLDGTKIDLNLGQVAEDPATSRGDPQARHVANPEAYFESLKDLAGSMHDIGLLQPILVREADGGFLVICGRRRLAAARYLGWETIPAIVCKMTDDQAATAELVENLQRADLDPLDEAAGYKRLADAGHSVAEIANMVHRAPSTVAGRLALLDLPGAALDAVREGRLTMAVAAEIAKLPGENQRAGAAARLIQMCGEDARDQFGDFEGADDDELPAPRLVPATLVEACSVIRREFMSSLKDAPFDPDAADLVPAAGSCTACPRRTGNAMDLFGGLVAGPRGQDICTYLPCYNSKREAHVEQALAAAREAGLAVLPSTQAEKAFGPAGHLVAHKWVDADSTARNPVTGNLLKQTWRKALGKKAPQEVVAVVPATGKVVSLYSRKAAEAVLAEKYGKPEAAPTATPGTAKGKDAKLTPEQRRARAARGRAQMATAAVIDSLVGQCDDWDGSRLVMLELVRLAVLDANEATSMIFCETWDHLGLDPDDVEPYVAKVEAEQGDVGIIRLFADGVLRGPLMETFRGRRQELVADRIERLIGRSFVEILADVDRQLEAEAGAGGED